MIFWTRFRFSFTHIFVGSVFVFVTVSLSILESLLHDMLLYTYIYILCILWSISNKLSISVIYNQHKIQRNMNVEKWTINRIKVISIGNWIFQCISIWLQQFPISIEYYHIQFVSLRKHAKLSNEYLAYNVCNVFGSVIANNCQGIA